MNEIFLTVLALVSLPLLAIFTVSYLRAVGPHSRKMAKEQADLDRKTVVASGTPAASTVAGGRKRLGRLTSHWPSILLVIVGAVLVYWGFQNTQIRPTDAGSWGWTNWLPLIIFWGIAATLVAINVNEKTASILQKVLAGVMLALLVVFPLVHGIWGEKSPSQQAQYAYGALIPLTSLPQSVWPNLVLQPVEKSALKEIPRHGMRAKVLGNNVKVHVVYKDSGGECIVSEEKCKPGEIAFYVTNTSKEINIISYAFEN